MTFKKTMAKLFSTAEGTYYKWKKENRPIINLLETYFTKEDLEEFLTTGEISKQELTKNLSVNDIQELIKDGHNKKILEQIEELKKGLL
ncbi:hypothetical protein N5U00_07955 [Aliarcobacter butzleri]|uniref:hypothetical protein n=1 Tax=Aliarcobacter butzleri TaxID=28197 RepID=UPI0021B5289E|nr:hypothetical protein [Aliarcobacter butzleri]MCT7575260.1 hypothetical protein [Aliarcobacter butzleri]